MKLSNVLSAALIIGAVSNCCVAWDESKFREIPQGGDGDCLFYSVISGAIENKSYGFDFYKYGTPQLLRNLIADKILVGEYDEELRLVLSSDDTEFKTKEEYVKGLLGKAWGGELEIKILGDILQTNIDIHVEDNIISYPANHKYNETINLNYSNNHYTLLLPRKL